MYILFIYPNFYDAFAPNLSITHLTTYINQRTHHKARILDLTLYKKQWKKILPEWIAKADIVGFTTTIPTTIPSLEIAREVKRLRPNLPIIMGGIYATCTNKKILEFDIVDYVCVGEGELSLSKLLDTLEKKGTTKDLYPIKGIWFKDNGKIIDNGISPLITDLDTLPFMDYDLWNPKLIWKFVNDIPMMGARGCQFQCTFCTQWAMHQIYDKSTNNGYYRIRSPKHICDEIEYQLRKYEKIKKFKGVLFNDDTFTANRKFVIDFCDEFIKRGLNMKLHWAINARIDTIDTELLLKMRRAGCYYLYFGIESASSKTRITYHKKFEQSSIMKLFKLCKKMGYKIKTYYIIDGPEETLEDSLTTLKYAWKLQPDTCHFMPFVPIPNTKAAEIYKQTNPKKYSQISKIIDLDSYDEKQKLKQKDVEFFYFLISAVIGHMPISFPQMIKNMLIGLLSSELSKNLYAKIIITTMWKYFVATIKLGKLQFVKDMFGFLQWLARSNMGISDLFYYTLKKYQLEDSFNHPI